jgi:hypothetical protein
VALAVALLLSAAAFYPLLAGDFRLSDAKFIATLALRGGNLELAEEKLREIIVVLQRLPVEQSQSVQYIAQVAHIRQMLAEVYLRGGSWRAGVEQIRALKRLPLRADQREASMRASAALLESALTDKRLPADSPEAALLREERESIRRNRRAASGRKDTPVARENSAAGRSLTTSATVMGILFHAGCLGTPSALSQPGLVSLLWPCESYHSSQTRLI